MPNWAYQEIHCKNAEDLEKLKNLCADQDGDFDFNTVTPMPEDLKYTTSPSNLSALSLIVIPNPNNSYAKTNDIIQDYIKKIDNPVNKELLISQISNLKKIRNKPDIVEEVQRAMENDKTFDLYCDMKGIKPNLHDYGFQMLENYVKYGVTNWYDWTTENWDVKWNASNTSWGDTSVYFETAWSPAIKPIIKASEILQIPLFIERAEEQFTEYGGYVEIENGQIINDKDYDSNSKEMFIVSAKLIDADQDCFKFDEKRHEIVSEWDFEDYDGSGNITYKGDYKTLEDIPKLELKNLDLEEFLEK